MNLEFINNIYNNYVYMFQLLSQKYNGKMRLFGSLTSGISSVSLLVYSFNMKFYNKHYVYMHVKYAGALLNHIAYCILILYYNSIITGNWTVRQHCLSE